MDQQCTHCWKRLVPSKRILIIDQRRTKIAVSKYNAMQSIHIEVSVPTSHDKEITGIVSITRLALTSWRFLHVYAGLLVDVAMIALFGCQRLDQNSNGGAKADNNKPWPNSLIVSDYGRIRYYNQIFLKIGRAPITNVNSDTYCTVSIIPYWELTHRENPNIHHTPW